MTDLGIVADEIDRDFAKAVRIGLAAGLRRYEIRNLTTGRAPMCDAAELRLVESIAKSEGLEITALSPGLLKYTEDEAAFHREMTEVFPRAADLAQRWSLPGLIVFGFHKPGATEENAAALPRQSVPPQVVDWLQRAGKAAHRNNLLLMIEPEPICWADTATVAAGMIVRASAEGLAINYDPGNVAWLTWRDPIDDFAAAAPWIRNVHVKDLLPLRSGETRPQFVAAGEGLIDYRAHFQALSASGYTGPVSLEPHMNGSLATIERCREAAERAIQPQNY